MTNKQKYRQTAQLIRKFEKGIDLCAFNTVCCDVLVSPKFSTIIHVGNCK